eukprot:TRINITY_DN77316_c0_g1_i4.p1 TRINITY_DN77316_c0_g1~~TRINITY_DN77316_c0_g1_i4.p1  ORF type:complete len:256 (+),score=31.62 TRINITY_DN77316_c0_g1_i4:364-1131(+)
MGHRKQCWQLRNYDGKLHFWKSCRFACVRRNKPTVQSFYHLQEDWFQFVVKVGQAQQHTPIVCLVANKMDEEERIVTPSQHNGFVKDKRLFSFIVSARSGFNVRKMFYRLAATLAGVQVTRDDVEAVDPGETQVAINKSTQQATTDLSEVEPIQNIQTQVRKQTWLQCFQTCCCCCDVSSMDQAENKFSTGDNQVEENENVNSRNLSETSSLSDTELTENLQRSQCEDSLGIIQDILDQLIDEVIQAGDQHLDLQ